MNLSIIIVNWNTRDLLAQCLSSIYANPPSRNYEILVVDNFSSDDSTQMVGDQYPHVKLIQNLYNVGFARANNQAIKLSKGQYVLLLNPDTEVKFDALEVLIRFMDAQPQIGAVGPLTFNPDNSLQYSCYPKPTLSRELWRLLHLDAIYPYGSYRMEDWCLDEPREVDTLLGACLLIRREALDQVGLLDEDYFVYSEEIDICYRLKKSGWRLYWVPEAKIIHFGGQSTKLVATEMFLQLYKGKVIYFRKHYGKVAALFYKFILLVSAFSRLLVIPLALFEKASKRQKHLKLATYYYRLISDLPTM